MSVCFTMSVADEHDLVDDRVARLRAAYRDCRIVLFPEHCGVWPRDVDVRPIERLYAVGHGGLIVERHLEAFIASGCAWWFKVDPDTVAWRTLHHLPEDVCFFGTIQDGEPGPSLQGGCIGGTRAAAAALLASGALRSPVAARPRGELGARHPERRVSRRDGTRSASASSTRGRAAPPASSCATIRRSGRSGATRRPTPGAGRSRIRTSGSTSKRSRCRLSAVRRSPEGSRT